MTKKLYKPSEIILENAKDAWEKRTSYRLPDQKAIQNEYVVQAILDFLDDSNDPIEIVEPDVPVIQIENENDAQPTYRRA